MSEEKKQNRKMNICHICGKEINSDDDQEYVKTKRGSDLYMHKRCVRRVNYGRNQKY